MDTTKNQTTRPGLAVDTTTPLPLPPPVPPMHRQPNRRLDVLVVASTMVGRAIAASITAVRPAAKVALLHSLAVVDPLWSAGSTCRASVVDPMWPARPTHDHDVVIVDLRSGSVDCASSTITRLNRVLPRAQVVAIVGCHDAGLCALGIGADQVVCDADMTPSGVYAAVNGAMQIGGHDEHR